LEKAENAARRHGAELAARQRRRRGHAARDEAGLGVEIEGEADDVAGHSLDLRSIALDHCATSYSVMPGFMPGIHVFLSCQDVDGRDIGERSDAVLRTSMPGH